MLREKWKITEWASELETYDKISVDEMLYKKTFEVRVNLKNSRQVDWLLKNI